MNQKTRHEMIFCYQYSNPLSGRIGIGMDVLHYGLESPLKYTINSRLNFGYWLGMAGNHRSSTLGRMEAIDSINLHAAFILEKHNLCGSFFWFTRFSAIKNLHFTELMICNRQ